LPSARFLAFECAPETVRFFQKESNFESAAKPLMPTAQEVRDKFQKQFDAKARIYRAPGRVNLIGEHTDYNQGFVMPAAINFSCWVGASPRVDGKLAMHSENFQEDVKVEIGNLTEWPRTGWASYPLGVAWALGQAGYPVRGCNLYIAGEVPLGSGLSSSAAIEVATALAFLGNSGASMQKKDLALLCQRAENDYVGARCGIMDQFIACHGRANHAVLLDCRSLDGRAIPIPGDIALVVCNSMVKHDLAASEYNKRRAECEQGVKLLKTVLPSIEALRDVSSVQLESHRRLLPDLIYKRCRHVVTEDERALKAASAFESGELGAVGRWMAESHESLRDDYEVSCRELDILVEIAGSQNGVLGARMTGGGFGGCTINLVLQGVVDSFRETVSREYQDQTGLKPEIYSLKAADGAEQLGVN
jgi:galactokinase